MFKKIQLLTALLILASLLLGACAAPAVEAPVATEAPAPVATEAPTQVPPTAVPPTPTPEPLPDWGVLFQGLIDTQMPPDKGYGTVKPAALSEELASKPPFLLDIREPAELENDGYIEGAVNISVRELLKNLDKLPGLDEPIVIYCASGHRGGLAFASLRLLGYSNVRNLAGGLGAWKKAELPVVTGSLPAAPAAISQPIVEDAALFTALDEFLSALPADKGFYTVKSDKLAEALASSNPPAIIDIRTAAEFEKDGYIDGAVNLPMDEILGKLDQLPAQDAPIVVHCVSGHRGSVVAMALRLMGYSNVVNLAGGLNAWKAANLSVIGGAPDWNKVWTDFLGSLPADQGYYTTKPDVLNSALADKPPFLLDVREAAELEKDGYITGAVHIPVREVFKNLDKLPAFDQPIVVYCASGHRGSFITAALRLMGWQEVANLAGGLGAWKKAEFPVESGLPAAPVAGAAPAVDAPLLAAFDAFIAGLPEGFSTVKSPDLNTELASGGVLIVDVRTPEEYAEGHIEGAINIPVTELIPALAQQLPDKAAKLVIMCKSGHRGGMAMMALSMLGYTDVRNLAGGMNAWAVAELPVVK
jgi:rhodanese-related sulfurtransferase